MARRTYAIIYAGATSKGHIDQLLGAPGWVKPLVYEYVSTGAETFFRNLHDPEPRSRCLFAFHQPDTLRKWLEKPETTLPARCDCGYPINCTPPTRSAAIVAPSDRIDEIYRLPCQILRP